jgi:O-antigen ligase
MFLVSPISPMNERAISGVDDVAALIRGEEADGTIGRRLALWRIAGGIIREQPIQGAGPGVFPDRVRAAVEAGELPEEFLAYEHPHSEYLSALIHAGPLGLFALLLMFGIALRRHARVWQTGLKRTRYLGWAGLAGLSTLAIMALSESLFERNIGVVWFGLLTALSAGLVHARRRQELNGPQKDRIHRLSVIVICKNQTGEIDRCLGSVADWADELIVLDSGSEDDTVERARRYTDQVFETDWPGYGKQKQRALDKARGDWVLSLDADEAVSDELRREIDQVLSEPDPDHAGYRLCWRTHAFDSELSFGHWARAPLRLFRRDVGRFTPVAVHETVVLNPGLRIGFLEAPLRHYVYRDIGHARAKLSRYAALQANERFAKGRRVRSPLTPLLRAAINWLDNMLLRTAFLDGRAGWIMCGLHARYTYDKYRILRALGSKPT